MDISKHTHLLTFVITYIIVHIVRNITSLSYSFSDGFNSNLLIDFALWSISYILINLIINNIFSYYHHSDSSEIEKH